jgi:hypothetical protein
MSDVTPATPPTPADPATPTTPTTPGPAPASSTAVDFNITLELGNPPQAVTIFAKDLADVATKGLHFALPPDTTITLGSLKNLIDWLNAQLETAGAGANLIPNAAGSSWPDYIATIFNGILTAVVTVTRFTLDQDAKLADGTYPPVRFTLDVTGTAVNSAGVPTPIPIINNLFSVVGGGIGVTRTYVGAPTTLQLSGGGTTPVLPAG